MAAGLYLTLLFTGRALDLSLLKAVYGIYLGLLLVLALSLLLLDRHLGRGGLRLHLQPRGRGPLLGRDPEHEAGRARHAIVA